MGKKTVQIIPSNTDDIERQFAYVDSIDIGCNCAIADCTIRRH